MGIFGASKIKNTAKFEELLIENEYIEQVYILVIDEICFTNKRIIFFDNKLISTKKKRISIPYNSIASYAIEHAGIFDMDSEITLFCRETNFELEFVKGTDLNEIDKILAKHICK